MSYRLQCIRTTDNETTQRQICPIDCEVYGPQTMKPHRDRNVLRLQSIRAKNNETIQRQICPTDCNVYGPQTMKPHRDRYVL